MTLTSAPTPITDRPVPLSGSLTALINKLNAVPPASALAPAAFLIEQDWVARLGDPYGQDSLKLQTIVALMNEIERLKMRLGEVEGLVDSDPLCPVLNRRAFERELTRAISMARRTGVGGSVLFLDMNGLKKLNDTYGHVAGDKAILRLSKTLVLSTRKTDHVARLGGDEFAVLMPNTPPTGAGVQGERIVSLLSKIPLMLDDGTSLTLATSFGVATFDGNSQMQDVLDQADAAMYAHKKACKEAALL